MSSAIKASAELVGEFWAELDKANALARQENALRLEIANQWQL